MDVFAITCTKHICYIEADPNGLPYCPKQFEGLLEKCTEEHDWHIYQSHNTLINLTEHVRTAVHDLNGIVNRLNNQIKPQV